MMIRHGPQPPSRGRAGRLFLQVSAAPFAAAVALAACLSPSAQARPLWEAGIAPVAIDQQAYPGSSARVRRQLLLPYVIYRGPLLRAADGQVGVRALSASHWEVDLGLSASLGSDASLAPAREGMPDLGTLFEFGPRLKAWPLGRDHISGLRFELPVRAVLDLSRAFDYRGLSVEPRVSVQFGHPRSARLRLGLGALLGDRRLADGFYGVAPAYARPGRPAYDAQSGLITWRATASLSWPIGDRWLLGGFVRLDDVSGAANRDSPLVDARTGWSAGITLALRLAVSREQALDEGD